MWTLCATVQVLLMFGNAINELILLRANLNALARVRSRAAVKAAASITAQIRIDTSAGLDCYGRPFAPLAVATLRRGRRPPPMTDTGRSLRETRAQPIAGAGIAIVLGGAYGYHLRRTGTRPARQVLPVRAGLPASWKRRIEAEEAAIVKAACPALRKVSR